MNAKQFAWTYLIRGGKCNVQPSYYGGFEPIEYGEKLPSSPYLESWNDPFIAAIKKHGVDWENTKAPITTDYSVFAGTFVDSENEEKLTGTLVLKNGETQFWFGDLPVSDVFRLMADTSELVKFASQLKII